MSFKKTLNKYDNNKSRDNETKHGKYTYGIFLNHNFAQNRLAKYHLQFL